jgi:Ulp1 family protease
MGRILNFDPDRSIFNYELGRIPDIVLIPMHFANHWGLIVHDCTFGTFFADSKIGFVTITPQRLQLIENILQFLLDDQTFSTNLQVLTRNQCSQQPDGNSCGYYVDLFAERYLKDRRFDLGQFDLRLEKRRILWHINQLYTTDDVTFRPGNFH